MSPDLLRPPPERDLPPGRHAELRARVVGAAGRPPVPPARAAWVVAGDGFSSPVRSDGRAGPEADLTALYRVAPEVARVRVRVSTPGADARWFEAPIVDGFALASATGPDVPGTGGPSRDFPLDVSATDARGNELIVP